MIRKIRTTIATLAATFAVAVAAAPAYAVTAGATGDGPANQAECNRWAGKINAASAKVQTITLKQGISAGIKQAGKAEQLENQAMDRGCFIVD